MAISESSEGVYPANLDTFFPKEQQRLYAAALMQRGGLTRLRAEYFVRLWAYLQLKQQWQTDSAIPQPLTQLSPLEEAVTCTHRETAELFYSNQDRGSDRAAGMMIDRFVALGLLEKRFDGQSLCLQVRGLPELHIFPTQPEAPVQLETDAFNPRTDAVPTANLIARSYAELIQSNRSLKDPLAASHKIVRVLRGWSQQYPQGMRVLRRQDNRNPVAITVLYPVAHASEALFFQPFNKGVYLTADIEVDPFQPAALGDLRCSAVYVRAWAIDIPYLSKGTIAAMLEDSQITLRAMRNDYPNLCDMYSAFIHPAYEELKRALGFQEVSHDKQRSYAWVYLAVDHFIELDMQQVVSRLKFGAAE
jgi:hypothetical protein